MSFENDLKKQIETYIFFPENIIDEVIKANCKSVELLTEKQMADICAIRRNNLSSANKFKYSLDELDLIIIRATAPLFRLCQTPRCRKTD